MPNFIICITVVNFGYQLAKSVPQVYGLPHSSSSLKAMFNQFLFMLVLYKWYWEPLSRFLQSPIFFVRLQRSYNPCASWFTTL